MKFVITGGGTAGHINPALATAQELRSQGHDVSYAGTPQGLEARLVPQEGFPYQAFEAAGFNRRKPLTLITSSVKIAVSASKARHWLAQLKPDAVIGFGGYVSIPLGLAASQKKIPLAVHEQNSASGMANRFLAQRAQLVALTYESAAKDFKTKGRIVHTGNPVRSALFEASRAEARARLEIPADALVLLAFGGSLGAQHINEALLARAEWLLSFPKLHIIHVAGTRGYETIRDRLARISAATGRWHLMDYCDAMGEAYAAADALVARSGATTLAEISALGKPALLVPYPFAAADEQTKNAQGLVDAGAALLIADSDLDSPKFTENLERLITDAPLRESMRTASLAQGTAQARTELARLIIDMVSARPVS
jgi:UDP-N-acetylglucosamine--N-acetylmuramyl-(pentapeptide) pyrophosphoryl-undecaprenol N-acetylglucosamine transferase